MVEKKFIKLDIVLHKFNLSFMSLFPTYETYRRNIKSQTRRKVIILVCYRDTEMHSLSLFIIFALCFVTTIMLIPKLLLSERNKVFMRQSMRNTSWCRIPLQGYVVAQNAIILVTWESTSTIPCLIYPEIRIHCPCFVFNIS